MNEESLFAAARQQPNAAQRRAFLDEACAGDERLRERVERLLAADEHSGGILDRIPATVSLGGRAEPVQPPGPPLAAEQVFDGRFVLVRRLGEGGMGEVWVADQTEPVQRRVALKVIRHGLDSACLLARFDQEQQALALMDHPNIAKVLDAGVSGGIPFFAMELVEGVPITTFCDARQLTPRERLVLFVPVCQAIQHAHQKGVIHRDVKPSNVLVAEHDGRPVPKVIDFGLAKAVGVKLTDEFVHTGFGAVLGTLEYMAPEQATFDARDVDTRADVYALGVLLYELLTGRPPIRREEFGAAGMLEMLRVIREVEPRWPSRTLATADDLPTLAAARGSDPRRLPALVRGELDWVVMKCLEKDRGRRYETASGLARDVERYLADEVVEARPTSTWYRLRKFVRRHRTPLATAGAFVLMLLGGVAVSAWQAVRATAAERKAVIERDKKEDARRQARQALNKLTDETVERLMARQAQLTEEDREFLRQVLALHEEFASAEEDSPESRAGVADARFRVGLIRYRLGEFAAAEEAYLAAIDLQGQLADEFPDRPDYRRDLARSHNKLGILLRKTSRPRQAEEAYNTAIDILQKLVAEFPSQPDYHQELARSHSNLGNVLIDLNQFGPAEKALRTAVDIMQKLVAEHRQPDYRRLLGISHQNLGNLLRKTDRLQEAEDYYLSARALYKELADEFPDQRDYRFDLAQHLLNLGGLYAETQRRPLAEKVFRDAVAILQKLKDEFPTWPDYRGSLAAGRSNLGNLLAKMKRYGEAEEEYLAARAGFERLAADFPLVSDYQSELAKTLVGLALRKLIDQDSEDARRLLEQALPHDLAALRNEQTNPLYQERHRLHRTILADVHGFLGDYAQAADAADKIARLGYDPAEDAYTASCVVAMCMVVAENDKQLTEAERAELIRANADRAMAHLRTAVRHGFKDGARMRKDPRLRPLDSRDDFQQMLRDLDDAPKKP